MLAEIPALDKTATTAIQQRIDLKTKPAGALGKLEALALQLALIQNKSPLSLNKPVLLIFAGDHGINVHGVSIAPSAVTQQMVRNFLTGGAAANCFCRSNGIELAVIDAGILSALPDAPGLIQQSLGSGTADFSQRPAMTLAQVDAGLALGRHIARQHILAGCDLLLLGEMGIANTSSAAALLAAATGLPVETCVGRGTGISDTQFELKLSLIKQALERPYAKDPVSILAEFGGFELVQLCGAILGAAALQTPVLIDGFIVSVAALLACQIAPNCRDYLIFAHQGAEAGHKAVLDALNAIPLLDLALRLGEGTGAALAVPLLRAAISFYNDMASFADAGVTQVVDSSD
ncbi:nicotinate-nucleotide--dimethylbenzimidazole phosphoribosyltransferase [Rheinheimera mesophila]|uniref:Nicotinate-nucleotide--dimethylbenzimidazole phosphoribosyltransferase n=2 Tax=Rheinheimera mesophila TaxID=1547515 RepID=A0A3P3QFQ1_9GAMM|nr:nicotinate-nucleotide--dimethylbenzimidazole phosphoribosyltransferase [Rheinheimera mesophila]RRJ19855.1 nicotinate-nucleotide--dimethylbenzimidazole phosphoribosyltransferase [Rheinheimera mesophila]